MTYNLLNKSWTNLDSFELRLLLNKRIGGPGQYNGLHNKTEKLYLPLAGSSCKIGLTFHDKKIIAIEPGSTFDEAEWERVSEDIEKLLLFEPLKVGREYSFSSFRVQGSWRGDCSGVQILPPPNDAPRAHVEIADHPFILEFPIKGSGFSQITSHRRLREHRNLTLLLNVLLAGRMSLQPRRSDHFWARVPCDDNQPEIKWVEQFFFAKLGKTMLEELSAPSRKRLEEVESEEYYSNVGHDGEGLHVPSDLDQSICTYTALSARNREKFDRATFWLDMASCQWNIAVSASFAALVSAIESLTERGNKHKIKCPDCGNPTQHEVPGATRRFKNFFGIHAPDATKKQLDDMYSLRSGILHGSDLIQLDQDLAFGWDPPWGKERELLMGLWGLTGVALRHWLKNPNAAIAANR